MGRRRTLAACSVLAAALATGSVACGGGDGDTAAGPGTAPAPGGGCATAVRPLTFAAEPWEAKGASGSTGVLWQQSYVFSNPNPVDVRLSSAVLVLDLAGPSGLHLKSAWTPLAADGGETVPAGKTLGKVAAAWLGSGNTASTTGLYAATSARVGTADCVVPIEKGSTIPPPAPVQELVTCEPRQAIVPC